MKRLALALCLSPIPAIAATWNPVEAQFDAVFVPLDCVAYPTDSYAAQTPIKRDAWTPYKCADDLQKLGEWLYAGIEAEALPLPYRVTGTAPQSVSPMNAVAVSSPPTWGDYWPRPTHPAPTQPDAGNPDSPSPVPLQGSMGFILVALIAMAAIRRLT